MSQIRHPINTLMRILIHPQDLIIAQQILWYFLNFFLPYWFTKNPVSFLNMFFLLWMCPCVYISTSCVSGICRGQKYVADLQKLEPRVKDSCESCGCWELNLYPMQDQQMLLTAVLFLQPHNTDFFIFYWSKLIYI